MQEKKSNTEQAFFALVRAGIWEKDLRLSPYGKIDFAEVLQLAEEQSVVGLVAAGIEHITDKKPQKKDVLQFIGRTVQLEQRNLAMNHFIGVLVEKMRENGIYTVLVKGQGVGQCFERPLWRSCGDVDLFFDVENYERAKFFLTPLASHLDEEDNRRLHWSMTVDDWTVELHGTLDTEFSNRVNKGISAIQQEVFTQGKLRIWKDGDTEVFLPAPNEDIILVFTHILEHFFIGGVGLRQLSDWCRLLWTYRDQIDIALLESRLRSMDLMPEWKGFAALAVGYLGMPVYAMPLYVDASKYRRKADRICRIILQTGNMGHNIDQTYRTKYPGLVTKAITFFRRLGEFARLSVIFPENTVGFWARYVGGKVKSGWGR